MHSSMILVGLVVLVMSAATMAARRHTAAMSLAAFTLIGCGISGVVYMTEAMGSPADHPQMFLAIALPTVVGLCIGWLITRPKSGTHE